MPKSLKLRALVFIHVNAHDFTQKKAIVNNSVSWLIFNLMLHNKEALLKRKACDFMRVEI